MTAIPAGRPPRFRLFPVLAVWLLVAALSAAAAEMALDNGRLRAEFDDHGLVSLASPASGRTLAFSADPASITIDGTAVDIGRLGPAEIEMTPARIAYRYARDPYTFDIVYELKPAWHFLTKQIVVTSARSRAFRVNAVAPLATELGRPVAGELKLRDGSFGVLCRFAGADASSGPAWSAFVLLQNPFMAWSRQGSTVAVSYAPDMEWSRDLGAFASDRLCLGLVELSGTRFPAQAVPEWRFVADYPKLLAGSPWIDAAESNALVDCVRAFLLYYPGRSVRVHIPWCENDYQIDVGTPGGVEEYKRIMDRAAELGVTHLLYTPANSELSRLEDNADDWGWENVLWFGLGQKLRKGEWDPRRDDVPAGLKDMLAYAASKNLKLMAYAYPSLPFLQDPAWTAWAGPNAAKAGADTGLRSFQDWWLDKLLNFMRATSAAGFSFDHWWIAQDKASGKYAQWFGCRRILEGLRRESFEAVVDGRQQYQNFGPWTWLAGSYPHPTLTDEQPESFKAFPDLHTDRVSADRQRFAAWTYSVERLTPPEIMPGFITHQSERNDEKQVMRRDRFRPRDWDALGWRYSLLSSIGTAPFHHVVNFIPARDAEEYAALSDEDKAWFRRWLDWTDENARYLHALRPIIGPPLAGRVDGTAAIVGDRGLVFLFNPNPGRREARFGLDAAIGLAKGDKLMIKELYPEEGRLVGSPEGFWSRGGQAAWTLRGREAAVYEIFPAPAEITEPVLFNVRGAAELAAGRLALTGVVAEPGTSMTIVVRVPDRARVRALTVNGVVHPFKLDQGVVTATVRFAGRAFGQSQSAGPVPDGFTGGIYKARITVPQRVLAQLAERKKSWPVAYTDDDLRAPWLGPWRLLLHLPIVEGTDDMAVSLTVNGSPVEVLKAYNSVYPHSPGRTFIGHYADLSRVRPDTPIDIEATLPTLRPGQFEGAFFENVETEYTRRIMAPRASPPRKK
ncbi:MAG TPA: hypothetical protein P5119_00635 [Candidatus Aminicenantes bacterium]|nr:hypothetical protein [Candidatus Aminicenantes bacterium]HRY63829.1 hypothetical protein [Candidatus Aminicenantes bacterium]HRZ70742.1 hypothetical protein [Candidatus Aminicenantes bacterium]